MLDLMQHLGVIPAPGQSERRLVPRSSPRKTSELPRETASSTDVWVVDTTLRNELSAVQEGVYAIWCLKCRTMGPPVEDAAEAKLAFDQCSAGVYHRPLG